MAAAYDIRCSGFENVESVRSSRKPFIVAPAHDGFFDGFIIASLLPELDFALAKEECWLNPLFRYFVPDLGGIPAVRRERLDVLRKRYGKGTVFDTYDNYITAQGRFRFDRYLPADRSQEIVQDIARVVVRVDDPKTGAQRMIRGLEDIDTVVLAQYVLLQRRNLLIFPQGTRKPVDVESVKHGLYNILHDLALFHGEVVPVIPVGLRYGMGWFYHSIVEVCFGKPCDVSSYLGPHSSKLHESFMREIMKDIRMMSGDK